MIGNRRAEVARSSESRQHVAAPVPDHAPPENPAVAAVPVLAVTFGFLVLVAAIALWALVRTYSGNP